METLSKKLSRVSPRKVAANRQNALKSTGPKTPRGKAYSRRNALQHGLFAIDGMISWCMHFGDTDKYQELLQRLAESYQPVGGAEELEVQQIAACWWKRSRVWRYENASIVSPLSGRLIVINERTKKARAGTALLNSAALEIEASGKVSDELKAKIFADAGIQDMWKSARANQRRVG